MNIFSKIGILIIVLIFCSCTTQVEEEKYSIGFSQCLSNHPWRAMMNKSMKIKSSLDQEIDLEIFEAHGDASQQIADIQFMIEKQFDLIIISPLDPDSIKPIVEKAYAEGIPIILIDRKIDSDSFTSYVGADNFQVGVDAANYILSDSNSDLIQILEIRGIDNSTPTKDRSRGFHQALIDSKNKIKLNTIKGVDEKFSSFLDSIDQLPNYVYAFNDELAYEAWKIAQKKRVENRIKFLGVDGLSIPNGGIEMVQNGILYATIYYPTGGAEAIDLASDILNGRNFTKENILKTVVIDRFNADIMLNQFIKIYEQQEEINDQIISIDKQKEKYYVQNSLLKLTLALLIIILSLSFYSIYSIVTIRRKNGQLENINQKIIQQRNKIERIAKEAKESNEAKINFFTGISHEFKTPITLIQSSIESLTENKGIKNFRIMEEIELIYNNSNRLLRLINNLLDFRRVENRNFNLRVSKTNLFDFSSRILKDFEREARKRNISLELISNNQELDIYIDRSLMDKVYFNILSNAFKFTPENGKIEIIIEDNLDTNEVFLMIKDSGIGIPDNEIDHIFDAFFKGSVNRKNSSGIGLHLVKQFVDLHLGSIQAKSKHGTEFTLKLLKGRTHFNEDQIVDEAQIFESSLIDFSTGFSDQSSIYSDFSEDNSDNDELYTVLIIEDNPELSYFLRKKLKKEYNVLLSDGKDAIKKAFDNVPDIIISDLNLPEISGFEICQQLKKDLKTSHIPILILTALGDKDSYIKGLESGADMYLTKPFNFSVINQSLKALLFNREKLRYYYTNNIFKINKKVSFGHPEQQFLTRLNSIIKDNIQNPNFNVENLAESLNISRVQLYRKVKALVGISISDYITNFKLETSKELLKDSSLSISEVAYNSGFSSPSYFSTTFKNKYKVTPVTYRKSFNT
ncbi:substrate-binding domain-containing protein [Zunongwangia sp. SCSIO 43204]|uniref:substrate-binding domain-containing protein n=1 Tax=Zunongwangia sp. SCSIO 43204 TaxID=2779359 RepID=UPI001CA95D42|nr:substrate-binding domain-containing protein [Zunongwangia sp. SCSIO 43204]UAB84134.1 substrate-binding domain-containing protein [Zunongwangia sp. SCSIO 43204]